MGTNPNQAFKGLKGRDGRMMTGEQRFLIERLCEIHDISLIALTTKALGHRKRTRDLTHVDASRCILKASVWKNLEKIGEE